MGIISSSFSQERPISYMQSPTIGINVENTKASIVTYKDSLGKDFINLHQSNDKIPIHYFKNIRVNACSC